MSATTAHPVHLDVSSTSHIPFWRTVMVEFRKSYDTRAGFWYLVSIGILVTLVEGFILTVTLINEDPILLEDFAFIAGGLTNLLLPVLGIMLVTSEWTQRSAMVSFALEPRRIRVVLAKLVVGSLYVVATLIAMFVIGVLFTTVCEIVQPEMTGWDVEWTSFIGFAVVQFLTMAIGFAFAALLLNTPLAIVVFFLYWYLVPIVLAAIGGIRESLGDALEWINFQAAVVPLIEWDVSTAEEWGKILVSGVLWIGVPLFAGMWRILRAEVK